MSHILGVLNLNNWYKHITKNTMFREGQKASLLDLILTSEEGSEDSVKIEYPLGKSDHVIIL